MEKFFAKLMTLIAVAFVGVSCEKSLLDEVIYNVNNEGAILYVSYLSNDTRVSFEDNDAEGLKLAWAKNDTFTIYDVDGSKVDNFICISISDEIKFRSESSDTRLTDDANYTAIYPASDFASLADAKSAIDPYTQNGDDINNLDNSLYMLANFSYTSESKITFAHQMAVMTFKFKSTTKPKRLVFENGEESYSVNYSEITSDDSGIFTSHIMINPCDGVSRELTFSLYAEDAAYPYEVRKATSTKAYEVGQRYTAPIFNCAKENFFSGGLGSEADPYQISTTDDLRELSDRVNGSNGYVSNTFKDTFFKVTTDIELGGIDNEFTAIGKSSDSYFRGTFDGDGYTISGLYINQPEVDNQALFGYTFCATIMNITISGQVTGNDCVGGIVGRNHYASTLSNCYSNVKVSGMSRQACVGGVVGYNNESSTLTNCHNSAEVSSIGTSSYVGGVVGYNNSSSTLTNCYNSGVVSGASSVGGVVGLNNDGSQVTNCFNSAKVNDTGTYACVGGVVGWNYTSSTITNCHNGAEVSSTGSNPRIGGVVGKNESSTVANCYNNATVNGTGSTAYIGGVVGWNSLNYSWVYNCYNSGVVNSTSDEASVGGVVGLHSSKLEVQYSYYDNQVYSNGEVIGEVIGEVSSDASAASYTCEGKLSKDMQDLAFVTTLNNGALQYNNEVIVTIKACAWTFNSGGYPTLDFNTAPASNNSNE